MARLYTNENFPLKVVLLLKALGHDVLTSMDAGNAGVGIPDDEVLEFAVHEKRILLTINRKDFIKLHRQSAAHYGVIVCTENHDIVQFAQQIHKILLDNPEMVGKLERVYKG